MRSGKVQIDDLRIKAPGLTAEQARQLGRLVAQRLADAKLKGGRSRTVPGVRVQARANRSLEVMANEIVSSIRSKLS